MRRVVMAVFFCVVSVWAALAQTSTSTTAPAAQATVASPTAPTSTAKTAPQPTQAKSWWMEAPDERWWLPKGNWIYGWGEFDIAPEHNEPDPNLCAANSGDFGGANATCTAFARYLIPAEVTLRPFGKTALRRIKIFYNGTFIFGKNVPQYSYTWSMDGIGWEKSWGGDIYLGRRFDLRLTQHFLIQQWGSYSHSPGYLGPNGPWGRYFTVGVRKSFGNPKVVDEGAK